jgi:hypothetical protein
VRSRVTLGLAALRIAALGALVLLVWNPSAARVEAGGAVLLLDASLSMTGHGGRWREALDTARSLARGGVIWRFGERVAVFDTLPPTDGASRLAPALAAAAARGGPVTIVSDGVIADLADVPPDLVRGARIVVLPQAPFFDAFVASVDGPRRVAAGDTIRLRVSYGTAGIKARDTAGKRPGKGEGRKARLVVSLSGRRVASRDVALPDSGIVSTELTLPFSPFPGSSRAVPGSFPAGGWRVLEVRLEGIAADSEPRDDARVFVLEVSPQPSVVLLASPPDWETRFLARALEDVARVPVRTFIGAEPGGQRWRDATTLENRASGDVARAVSGAALVIEAGDPAAFSRFSPKGAVLRWPAARRLDGDWYALPPSSGPSPLVGALAGVAWDSLPPATSLTELTPDSSMTVAVAARLGRRGPPRPMVVLSQRGGTRRAVIAAGGLYRWAFRGGASGEAYRALVAGLVDWLLAGGEGRGERFVPVTYDVPNGMPLQWRWTGMGEPRDIVVSLTANQGPRVDTLRFDAGGRAELRLAPGVYRYAAADGAGAGGGAERGVVAVDTYSDEWRPGGSVLAPQPGAPEGRLTSVALRDRWWLFFVAIAAFAAEWAWRRRQGLP